MSDQDLDLSQRMRSIACDYFERLPLPLPTWLLREWLLRLDLDLANQKLELGQTDFNSDTLLRKPTAKSATD